MASPRTSRLISIIKMLPLVLLGLAATAAAQCGSGTIVVDGDGSTYTTTVDGSESFSGDYLGAINSALESASSGQTISVLADGGIGDSYISIPSGIVFEVCGIMDVGYSAGHGAIEIHDVSDVSIPYLTMTGAPYFGFRVFGVSGLNLGEITMNLSGGLGIRFERDEAGSTDVTMGTIIVNGAGSHAVETWNIDGLEIGSVIATDVGECGLLLQTTTNAHVGLVDGTNVASGNGYATFRMANTNGLLSDGSYTTNVFVDSVVSRGGGRGIFCVSESGGAEIANIDLSDNENNSILIENCYGVSILGGTVNGGGEIRISAREEFANTADISISIEANDVSVVESPCGENITWDITGTATLSIC